MNRTLLVALLIVWTVVGLAQGPPAKSMSAVPPEVKSSIKEKREACEPAHLDLPQLGGFSMRDFLCHVINKYGTDQHPSAKPNGLLNFQPDYVRECVERALASGNLSEAARKLDQEYLAPDGGRMTGAVERLPDCRIRTRDAMGRMTGTGDAQGTGK